jgi:outer membrane protein assembly factor BamD (BamD/ComL family)
MNPFLEFVRDTGLLVVVLAALCCLLIWTLRRSEDPPRLILKWVFTLLFAAVMYWVAAPLAGRGGEAALAGLFLTMVCGLGLAAIWRRSIASVFARPFTSLYDGGDQEIEPQPFYSIAQSRRKQGKYNEAVAEVRRQLSRFPADFQGHMLLAEIQVENLNDLPGAEITIHRLCSQPDHEPRNIAMALSTLADWHLKWHQNRDAARQALEKIIELLPNSEMAALAAQRIGHLAQTDHLLGKHDRQKMTLMHGVENIGLLSGEQQPHRAETDPAQEAAGYVKHLELHPLDTEAREKLATLYADHYGRLDLATAQLDQLIAHPNQPPRQVVHWLNLLADLQIRHSGDPELVRQTIQRIADRFPDTAAAQIARNRLDHLALEFKSKQKSQAIKLGSYEQNIGLKQGSPHQL